MDEGRRDCGIDKEKRNRSLPLPLAAVNDCPVCNVMRNFIYALSRRYYKYTTLLDQWITIKRSKPFIDGTRDISLDLVISVKPIAKLISTVDSLTY